MTHSQDTNSGSPKIFKCGSTSIAQRFAFPATDVELLAKRSWPSEPLFSNLQRVGALVSDGSRLAHSRQKGFLVDRGSAQFQVLSELYPHQSALTCSQGEEKQ